MMDGRILQLEQVHKNFGTVEVLKGISADVYAGDVIGLLGLKGAGKTTLLETALGFSIPRSGSVRLFGQTASALENEDLKQRVGFVPQKDELIDSMKGTEFLGLVGMFYASWNKDLIARLAGNWDVPLDQSIRKLSAERRQKLSILAALGHEPELIVLDEPVASLDPLARRNFMQELVEIVGSGERTILFSTHIVSDLERIANRVWIIRDGHLLIDETLHQLKKSSTSLATTRSGMNVGIGGGPGLSLEEIFRELDK